MYSKAQRILTIKVLSILLFTTNAAMAQTVTGIFPKGDKPNGLLFFGLTILALFLTLAIHELGHLVAGIIQGFRFELFIVGLLGVKRAGNTIKVFFNKNVGYMGGIAATVPVNHSAKNKRKFAIIMASGPAASFLFSIISFLLFSLFSSGAARGFWFVAGTGSIAVFLATTIPTKSGIFFTDRARFQRLMSNGKVGENEDALLTIIAYSMKENSCKNIPLAKAKLLQSDTEGVMRFWGYYYEYYHFKDNAMQSETEAARRNLYSIKDTIPSHLWKSLQIETTTIS
jgi:hypothetical protein